MDSLITNMSNLMSKHENEVLREASEDLAGKYCISREATDAIAKEILKSESTSDNSESDKMSQLKQYDLLIQKAEDLEILMKINEVTKAIKPDLISSQLNEVIAFLTNEVLDGKNNNQFIIENMKRRESVYRDFLLKSAQENSPIFWENLSFLMTDCAENTKKRGSACNSPA